jgi:hypothetical protein
LGQNLRPDSVYPPEKFLHGESASEKNPNSDDHFDRCFSSYPNERKLQNHEKHNQDISQEDGARLSFPVKASNPQLESRAMRNKQTKLRSGICLTRHLIGAVLCLAVMSIICAHASAQNLFAVDAANGGIDGIIDEFTPNGVRSIVISLRAWPLTSPVICLWWMAAPSINLLRPECEPRLPPG